MVVVSPVALHVVVASSIVLSGKSVLTPLMNAFLFVISTPDLGCGCLTQAVTNCFGVCELGACRIFPRYLVHRSGREGSESIGDVVEDFPDLFVRDVVVDDVLHWYS